MSRIRRLNSLYQNANSSIQHIAIHDDLLHTFSRAVRQLNFEVRDWANVSTDLDEALACLRRAEWRLRNQPGVFNSEHPAKVHLARGLFLLNRLSESLDPDLQNACRIIVENGNSIFESKESTLNSNLVRLIKEAEAFGSSLPLIVVRQEDLVASTVSFLNSELSSKVKVSTGFKVLQTKPTIDKLFVIGNSNDYQSSLITVMFTQFGTTLIGYDWVPEQDAIETSLSELACKSISIKINHSITDDKTDAIDISHFLEPSIEISARQLKHVAKGVYSKIEAANADEDVIPCKAYLLAGNQVVFLPTKDGALDCLDLNAQEGSRVQRMSIQSLGIGSVILLRVGKSDSESIFEMANAIGGAEAVLYRELQKEWKDRLKDRISILGSQLVVRQLKDLGIVNPWINEWKSFKNNIRPENDHYFRTLLIYLDIEPEETMKAMNALRRLHLIGAMRFRKMLKDQFENADLDEIYEKGFLIEDLGESPEIAKLGAYACLSIGDEVFDVPESAVKQLQGTVD